MAKDYVNLKNKKFDNNIVFVGQTDEFYQGLKILEHNVTLCFFYYLV